MTLCDNSEDRKKEKSLPQASVEIFKVDYHTRAELEKMSKKELIDWVIWQEGKIRYLMDQ